MSTWDELSPAHRERIAAHNRRTHSAVNREIEIKVQDARGDALWEAVTFLYANGFDAAATALNNAAFDQSTAPAQRMSG